MSVPVSARMACALRSLMPALSAIRCDARVRETYKRLIGNGKKPLVAIVAIMRKIVVIANARIRDAARPTATA